MALQKKRRGRKRRVFFVFFAATFTACSQSLQADDRGTAVDPIPTSNRIPFIATHGLPPARSAFLLPSGRTQISLHADAANTSIVDGQGAQSTIIDGETHRLELAFRRGIGSGWEIGANLPVLRHSGGFLDRPIEEWHNIFGLPSGNRDRLPRNRLLFSQRNPDGRAFLLDSNAAGVGDLQLLVSRQLADGLALRTSLKLPTGDSGLLTGSGATSLSSSLHASGAFTQRLHWHVSAGLLFSGSSEVLQSHAESTVAFGSTTLAWRAVDSLVLKAQLDTHTAVYKGTGEPLNRATFQLSIGAAFAVAPNWTLDIGFSEDVAVETAPDIVFHAGLTRRF